MTMTMTFFSARFQFLHQSIPPNCRDQSASRSCGLASHLHSACASLEPGNRPAETTQHSAQQRAAMELGGIPHRRPEPDGVSNVNLRAGFELTHVSAS
jgi:hypothetical protein